jgi:ornithine cyclodeaminase/alanine dehydrogenase-like protein (mu-crystallin family)
MMLSLSEAEIAKHLTWDDLVPAMEKALIDFSTGGVIQPLRNMMTIEDGKRYLGIMPAVCEFGMGAKLVSFFPGNATAGQPTHFATIMLFETAQGRPLAVMDGRLITEMRTAAVSAAVTKRLADPNSRVLTLLGSGVQAKAHLEVLRTLYTFAEVRVWSPTTEHAWDFARMHGALAMDLESAVRDADIIVTATHATLPFLAGKWLKPGAHVNSVGAPRPDWRELDDESMHNIVVVDSREATLAESGDVILSGANIVAEAGEIFAGTKLVPASATTIFKSVGLAVEDIATAMLVYQRAMH